VLPERIAAELPRAPATGRYGADDEDRGASTPGLGRFQLAGRNCESLSTRCTAEGPAAVDNSQRSCGRAAGSLAKRHFSRVWRARALPSKVRGPTDGRTLSTVRKRTECITKGGEMLDPRRPKRRISCANGENCRSFRHDCRATVRPVGDGHKRADSRSGRGIGGPPIRALRTFDGPRNVAGVPS
jgi:hypothetical protein